MMAQMVSSPAFARDFFSIPDALVNNPELAEAMCTLIAHQPIAGKATEGGNRLTTFRLILTELTQGQGGFFDAMSRVDLELAPRSSIYGGSRIVFANGWAERLVRTQFSRFYNQAVLDHILATGQRECFVPHSGSELPGSDCSLHLAGRNHDATAMRDRLITSYALGQWEKSSWMIPHHPHCTHVVTPVGTV